MVTKRLTRKRQKTDDRFITLRLHPGDDDDLIRWWDAIPNGDGSDRLKEKLRSKAAESQESELTALRQAVESMARQIALLSQQISQGVVVSGAARPVEEIDDAQATKRKQQILGRKW